MHPIHIIRNLMVKNRDSAHSRCTILDQGTENILAISPDAKFIDSNLTIHGSNNQITLGAGTYQNLRITLLGNDSKIIIGKQLRLTNTAVVIASGKGFLHIGDSTTCEGAEITIHEPSSILIEEDCMISAGVQIVTSDGHSILDKQSGKRINPASDIKIGKHTWLGNGVRVGKGAHIAANTIVGARSLVLGAFLQEHTIIAGTPAKIKKTEVTWTRQLL